jgi:hypothetical protein
MAFNLNHINCVYTLSVYVDCACVYILAEGKQFLGCLLIGGEREKRGWTPRVEASVTYISKKSGHTCYLRTLLFLFLFFFKK